MRQPWWLAVALLSTGCPPTMEPPTEDAGEEMPVVFDGPTTPAGIPDFYPPYDAGDQSIDSGVIVIDMTCCQTRFSISDVEPAEVMSAKLRIGLTKFAAGVDLARDGGRWSATACFPVNSSSAYFYEFTFDGGLIDAGNLELDDGGSEPVLVGSTVVSQRGSDEEPGFTDSEGLRFNFYSSVPSCDGLDGSVPRP